MEPIGGGRNSQVYRLQSEHCRSYIAKYYFRHDGDERDRLGVEFSSLEFLWEHGIRSIPKPIRADRTHACAIYEDIEGSSIPPGGATPVDVDAAVRFLMELNALCRKERSRALPAASEACFSIQAILESLQRRLTRLAAVNSHTPPFAALDTFLQEEFLPALDEVTRWCRFRLQQEGLAITSELGQNERTLSPSDFGFHNALRRQDGRLVFLDFEYFGWDDPAKTVVDFLLHPAMTLSEDLKQRFLTELLRHLDTDGRLAGRVETVYPLFGLKWCLIFLNEFVQHDFQRRQFANRAVIASSNRQAEQLSKARRMLQKIREDHEHFPYGN